MDAHTPRTQRRGPGRRPAGSQKLDRAEIIACGLALAKNIPLQELSIVRVAQELRITPALVHYHLNGRKALTAGIVNLFFSQLMKKWPQPSGKWKPDLEAVANAIFQHFVRYAGIASYFAVQNRFKVLISALGKDNSGPLFEFLERYFLTVRAVGLNAERTATYAILLIQFVHTSAHRTASRHWPGEQTKLKDFLMHLDRRKFPSVSYVRDSYLRLEGDASFEAGLKLIFTGLAAERRARKPAPAKVRRNAMAL